MTPMFKLTGQIVHVYEAPKGVNKNTGEEYGGHDKVQIMGQLPLPDGHYKMELIDIKTDQGAALKGSIGKTVSAAVAFFTVGKSVGFYVPKGHKFAISSPSQ